MLIRLVFMLVAGLLSACGGASVAGLEALHTHRAAQLEQVAHQFMKDPQLHSVGLAPFYDPSLCEHVNAWRRCRRSGPWEMWDIQAEKHILLDSLPDVLKRERVSAGSYTYFARFLRDNNLRGISGSVETDSSVDFTAGLDGLRYTRDTSYHLEQDHEYLFVKRLSPHWHVYTRDWN